MLRWWSICAPDLRFVPPKDFLRSLHGTTHTFFSAIARLVPKLPLRIYRVRREKPVFVVTKDVHIGHFVEFSDMMSQYI